MIVVSHPTGNAFLRAVLQGLEEANQLAEFHTTLAFEDSDFLLELLPKSIVDELLRRQFHIDREKVFMHPTKEILRLLAPRLGISSLVKHETGFASTDAVYRDLDRLVAERLRKIARSGMVTGVYAYEDAALQTFRAAHELGIKCFYDLPIAYWQTVQTLLKEEAQRWPQWEPTLGGTRDSNEKLERKTEEAMLADAIICPSKFVLDSLPENFRGNKTCVVAEFGTPEIEVQERGDRTGEKLRVLFAGSMGQRKGLADLFQAMKLLRRSDVELVVMGSPIAGLDFYKGEYADFTYEPTRPHHEVLRLMQTCDVFVLPSIVEGRALVQQEAMLCGLPLIVTPNAGGDDLIEEGKTGFLVPIRNPEAIAEKINWCADNKSQLTEMGKLARAKAKSLTWDRYRQLVLQAIVPLAKGGEQ
ncbi:MAG: glycosyltransferase family 4 protein [Candidatus Obscuribacterales bacterium]|nr:glycosyltransferase family 4 protein [Candidatus Obscuribacterales bacterium]